MLLDISELGGCLGPQRIFRYTSWQPTLGSARVISGLPPDGSEKPPEASLPGQSYGLWKISHGWVKL